MSTAVLTQPEPTQTVPATRPLVLNGEKLIGLGEAAASLPGYRGNDGMHPSAVWRWIKYGAKGADGQNVKLQGVRIGNRWLTSHESLNRFILALTGTPANTPQPRTPAVALRDAEKAGQVLERRGA
jgi:hypothetical protein